MGKDTRVSLEISNLKAKEDGGQDTEISIKVPFGEARLMEEASLPSQTEIFILDPLRMENFMERANIHFIIGIAMLGIGNMER